MKLLFDFLFQQDNAKVYTAKFVINYLDNKGTNVMSFLAQSPNLNPIKKVWSQIENKIRKEPLNTLDKIKTEVADAWKNLDINFACSCIESIPKRLQLVKTARGGPTKY